MHDHEPECASGVSSPDDGDALDQALEYRLGVTSVSDRLDKILAGLLPEHSRSRLQGWIESGHVLLNGQVPKLRQKAGPGDVITVYPQPAPEDLAFAPEKIPFEVIAESDQWVVINKQAGLVTHPGAGNWSGTLLNGLLYRYPELARLPRAGIVHRLDKDTSGAMVVARTDTAQTHLVRQLQARTVHREYVALAHGRLVGEGRVDLPIGRDPTVPVRMAVERPIAPKPAATRYQALRHGQFDSHLLTEVVCRLETGRTHQIRVHLSSLGHPLVGDSLYGGRAVAGAGRQMLHARALAFVDPATDQAVSFDAAIPADYLQVSSHVEWSE